MADFGKVFKPLLKFVILIGLAIIVSEYLVYYAVIFQCSWPDPNQERARKELGQISEPTWLFDQRVSASHLPRTFGEETEEESARPSSSRSVSGPTEESERDGNVQTLRAFFIADTHLLGSRLGHWFDKLRREWEMERAFQAAAAILAPEAVFVLGDLTDEGKWANDEEFEATAKRFWKMFRHPPGIHFKVVVGNHDVGFHNIMSKYKLDRFYDAFSCKGVEVVTLKNISFVLVNSMAFHGDNCKICKPATKKLQEISERLNCSRFGHQNGRENDAGVRAKCGRYKSTPMQSPILLQHFPLYRESDKMCEGVDGTPPEEKYILHGERREVISREATDTLLSWIQPRLVLSGHTHHGCYVVHRNSTPEISVPSFSWRNRKNPSFVLATITPTRIAINKCFLPEERHIIYLYSLSGVAMVIWLFWTCVIQRQKEHVKRL